MQARRPSLPAVLLLRGRPSGARNGEQADDRHGDGQEEHHVAAVPHQGRQQAAAQAHDDAASVDEGRLVAGDRLPLALGEMVHDQAGGGGDVSAEPYAQAAAEEHQVPEARVEDQRQRPGGSHEEQAPDDGGPLGQQAPADQPGGRDREERRDEIRDLHHRLNRRQAPVREHRRMDLVDAGRQSQIRHLHHGDQQDRPHQKPLFRVHFLFLPTSRPARGGAFPSAEKNGSTVRCRSLRFTVRFRCSFPFPSSSRSRTCRTRSRSRISRSRTRSRSRSWCGGSAGRR